MHIEKMCHTGIVGTIKGKYEGPVLLYRADMDGLPIKEETGLSFASRMREQCMRAGMICIWPVLWEQQGY